MQSFLPLRRTATATFKHLTNPSRSTIIQSVLASSQTGPILNRTMASAAMSKRLEGKTIVITGASSGIGRSTAFEFARTSPKNLKLVLTARRIDTLEEIAKEIVKEVGEGVKVLPIKLDVSNPEEVRGFVAKLPEEFKEIDVLVNNAYVCSVIYRKNPIRDADRTLTIILLQRLGQRCSQSSRNRRTRYGCHVQHKRHRSHQHDSSGSACVPETR